MVATQTQSPQASIEPSVALPGELDREALIRAFRIMYLARSLDDREILLKRQNRIFFQISGAGHEAVGVAAGMVLHAGRDWIFSYYRDRALALTLGMTAEDMLLQAVGAARDPSSGGRQMPSHWSSASLRIVTGSSPTGTQFLQAAGCAQGKNYLDPNSDEITLVCSGEGATSEGEFWETVNIACLERLPLLILVEDNGYAISVPVERQTAGGNVARLLEGFPGLFRMEVDGTNFIESFRALTQAADYCRSGYGPALVHASVIRPYSHSLSDDERLYKPQAEREQEAARDPLRTYPEFLFREGLLDKHGLERMTREIDREVAEITDRVLREAPPPQGSALTHLYSDKVDPASDAFDAQPRFKGEPRTMIDSINQTLHEEMTRDERIVVFGEDVADCSREQYLSEVKGKGGVFKATANLQRQFGAKRCFNTPLAEAGIVGRAIGLAVRGLRPIAEIQFFDYIWPAMMQLRDELATIRWRSNGGFSCPVVARVPIGGYLTGGAIYHSQCGEVTFTHIPGLRVVFPSNALDACGLLRTAIRCDDPVLFLEHKKLYREPYNRAPHPGPDFTIPFGKAKTVKPGETLTIITYGALVQKSLQAALQIEQRHPDASVEIIDLRSLSPYDWDAICASVKKTNRVLIAYEDTLSWGYGAEIAARIADELFTELDAPVRRVAALDTWVGYNPQLEYEILPQIEDLVREGENLLRF
ncbi:MAG: dehydrogenase E1 component subunit alpha/beta [Acidobacteriaceae bacterium]|nr:dehydrogenase E1 component subunit alpha/beta [Acidobacteriaceae bacterium]MBV9780859.1 dehydrogenase E1 component subunit alpha/beta [Acidobacteriaceae bacterium]